VAQQLLPHRAAPPPGPFLLRRWVLKMMPQYEQMALPAFFHNLRKIRRKAARARK